MVTDSLIAPTLISLTSEAVAGANNAGFDLNSDGLVNNADVQVWIRDLKGTKLGDANLDFSVDASDFNLWNGSKFTATAAWCNGDFNSDGFVDASDFNIWNGNKFQSAVAPLVLAREKGLARVSEAKPSDRRLVGVFDHPQVASTRPEPQAVPPSTKIVDAYFSFFSANADEDEMHRYENTRLVDDGERAFSLEVNSELDSL